MFDEMISKTLIQVIWVVGSIGIVLSGIGAMFADGTGGAFFLGLVGTLFGLLVMRVVCESLIVMFLIHENLDRSTRILESMQDSQRDMRVRFSSQPATASAPMRGWEAAEAATAASEPASVPRIAQVARKSGWDTAHASTVSVTKNPDSDQQ